MIMMISSQEWICTTANSDPPDPPDANADETHNNNDVGNDGDAVQDEN
jgi:hypothetical protein